MTLTADLEKTTGFETLEELIDALKQLGKFPGFEWTPESRNLQKQDEIAEKTMEAEFQKFHEETEEGKVEFWFEHPKPHEQWLLAEWNGLHLADDPFEGGWDKLCADGSTHSQIWWMAFDDREEELLGEIDLEDEVDHHLVEWIREGFLVIDPQLGFLVPRPGLKLGEFVSFT